MLDLLVLYGQSTVGVTTQATWGQVKARYAAPVPGR